MSAEYLNFADVFLFNFAMEFMKHTGINNYSIDLIEDKQLFYKPIYSLELIEYRNSKDLYLN